MPLPASPSDVENAVRDYLAGESCQVVAARHGISTQRLRHTLVDRGLWRTSAERYRLGAQRAGESQATDLPVDEIVSRYLAGESVLALARAFEVSRTPVTRALKNAGVDLRSNGAAQRLAMSRRDPEEVRASIANAQAAVRGSTRSFDELCKRATTREQRQTHVSDHERWLAERLIERGLDVIPQKAIGPYNVDIATGTVAVEVFGGGWHGYGSHARRAPERFRHILDQGWNLVVVWTSSNRWQFTPAACEYLVAFAELAGSDPAMRSQHRVIWGDGQEVPASDLKFDDLSVVPSRRRAKRPRT